MASMLPTLLSQWMIWLALPKIRRKFACAVLCLVLVPILIYYRSLRLLDSFVEVHRLKVHSELRKKQHCRHRSVDLAPAFDCLVQSNISIELNYPADADEHFRDLRIALAPWAQHGGHKMHVYGGYRGPWIENHWISHFEEVYAQGDCLSDHFGPYIPLLIPWVDLWLSRPNPYRYPDGLVETLLKVLRPDVPYITVSQNDEGITGRDELPMHLIPNVMVVSAGGYGHVPIPLLKQPEVLNNYRSVKDRLYDVNYVGSLGNAPGEMRKKMDTHMLASLLNYRYYYGERWREQMANSRFSLVPRGFGRTAFHLVETIQMGLVPVYVYSDVPWVPYADRFDLLVTHYSDDAMNKTVETLRRMSMEEIAQRETRIMDHIESHFSYRGVLEQIRLFLMNEGSDLKCQRLPDTIRDGSTLP